MSLLPSRYAQALIDLATDADQVAAIRQEILDFQKTINESPELLTVLSDVVIPKAERKNVLTAVLDKIQPSELFKKFLNYSLEKERMALLPAMIQSYVVLCDSQAGVLKAKVTSAAPLSEALSQQVQQVLTNKTGKTVAIEFKQDPSLIGGLVIQLGSRIFDGSLLGDLRRFQDDMLQVKS